jgi:hypothetical protein
VLLALGERSTDQRNDEGNGTENDSFHSNVSSWGFAEDSTRPSIALIGQPPAPAQYPISRGGGCQCICSRARAAATCGGLSPRRDMMRGSCAAYPGERNADRDR